MRKIISGPIASQFCVLSYWKAFMCFGINCVKRTEWECFTPSVDGLTLSVGQDSSKIIGKMKGNLTDTHFVWMVVRALWALIDLNGLSLLETHPWLCPGTQRLHLSSVLAWATVQVRLRPVLPSGWTLDPHCRQLVSWMDTSDVYYSLSPALSLAPWTLDSCCSLVSSPVPGPVSFHPWLGSLDGPWTWFITWFITVWGCW